MSGKKLPTTIKYWLWLNLSSGSKADNIPSFDCNSSILWSRYQSTRYKIAFLYNFSDQFTYIESSKGMETEVNKKMVYKL